MEIRVMVDSSGVYVARGTHNGVYVMKVGKSNDPQRRQQELGLTIDIQAPCDTERLAYEIEDKLRTFIIIQGGVRYRQTKDWFYFDMKVYETLIDFFRGLFELNDIDDDVYRFQRDYQKLLEADLTKAQSKIKTLQKMVKELQDELYKQQSWLHSMSLHAERHAELNREIGRLEVILEMRQQEFEQLQKPNRIVAKK